MLIVRTPVRRFPATRATGAGFSLVEVLIAMLVLSFGVLAAVALQLVSKRNAVDADQRSLAASYAYDLMERVRANSTQAGLVAYTGTPTLGAGSQGANPPVNCRTQSCTTTQVAFFDLWDWERQIDGTTETIAADGSNVGGLDSPRVCISGPGGGASGIYTIIIAWRGAANLPDNTANTCGATTGLYGTANEYRRSLTITAFLAAS